MSTKDGRPAVLRSDDECECRLETLAVRVDAGLMREIKNGLLALKTRKAKLHTLTGTVQIKGAYRLIRWGDTRKRS